MKSVLCLAVVAAACAAAGELAPRLTPQAAARPAAPVTSQRVQAALGAPVRSAAKCPAEMSEVPRGNRSFCIDRWEATLQRRSENGTHSAWPGNRAVDGEQAQFVAVSAPNVKPQGYISGAQAAVACANAGKRLCEIDEWTRACRGSAAHVYPYGDERRANTCNDRFQQRSEHPVVLLFDRSAPRDADRESMWQREFMNDPRLHELPQTVANTGSYAGCASEYGVYDLVGNLHEWTADPEGTFVGGFFLDVTQNGDGCGYRTRAHDFGYHDYSTGFRCCKDAE